MSVEEIYCKDIFQNTDWSLNLFGEYTNETKSATANASTPIKNNNSKCFSSESDIDIDQFFKI
jgi:hypothetical protein